MKFLKKLSSLFVKVDVNETGETIKDSLKTRRIAKSITSIVLIAFLTYLLSTGKIDADMFFELFKEAE